MVGEELLQVLCQTGEKVSEAARQDAVEAQSGGACKPTPRAARWSTAVQERADAARELAIQTAEQAVYVYPAIIITPAPLSTLQRNSEIRRNSGSFWEEYERL